MPTDRPNIIVFFTDQQRWDTCGCYGQRLDVTPNLDRMAAEGVRFERTYTCQPVCGPARAAIQTGKYPTEIDCFTNHRRLPADERTIAHALSEAGYEVGYIGKWHLASCGPKDGVDNFRGDPVPPDRRGGYRDYWLASDVLEFTSHSYDGHMFDADGNKREFPPGRYRADAETDWVIEYLRTRDGSTASSLRSEASGSKTPPSGKKPFFLFASYIEPHHQNDHHHFEGPKGSKERFKDFEVPGDIADADGDWREEFPDYLGCCRSLDENLGRVRDELERLEIADNTLVIFTSDHGCHFRTRNKEYKRSCHEGTIRVPMVACGPGFRGGKVAEPIASLIDLPPTLLAAGGVEPPEYMRGRKLQEIVDTKPGDWPKEAFLQISESHCGRAIRTGRWTYSVRAPGVSGSDVPASDVYVEDFLYDNHADPHQHNNLVAEESLAEVRAELRERLIRRMTAVGEQHPGILPASQESGA